MATRRLRASSRELTHHDTRKRILVHSLVFLPDGVSTAAVIGRIASELTARGHDLTVVATTPHYNRDPEAQATQPLRRRWGGLFMESEYEGVRVLHVPVGSRRRRGWWRILDYLHYHLLAGALTLAYRGRWDVLLATTPPPSVGATPERFIYRHADALVPITDTFGRTVVERGAAADRVHVIPNFAEVDRLRPVPKKQSRFARTHARDGRFVVLYAGNVGTTQDFETVLDAAEALDDVEFVIVGNGVRHGWLARQVASRTLRNVLLLPFQPTSGVPDLYGASDLCLVPLKPGGARGTFPSKIYTIMGAARPAVVLTDPDSSLAALVEESRCGWSLLPGDLAALVDTVGRARASPSEREARGRAGRRYVEEHHTPGRVIGAYTRLIEELTGKTVAGSGTR